MRRFTQQGTTAERLGAGPASPPTRCFVTASGRRWSHDDHANGRGVVARIGVISELALPRGARIRGFAVRELRAERGGVDE